MVYITTSAIPSLFLFLYMQLFMITTIQDPYSSCSSLQFSVYQTYIMNIPTKPQHNVLHPLQVQQFFLDRTMSTVSYLVLFVKIFSGLIKTSYTPHQGVFFFVVHSSVETGSGHPGHIFSGSDPVYKIIRV